MKDNTITTIYQEEEKMEEKKTPVVKKAINFVKEHKVAVAVTVGAVAATAIGVTLGIKSINAQTLAADNFIADDSLVNDIVETVSEEVQ